MNLSDLSEDERAVYLAAFGAFVGYATLQEVALRDIRAGAEVKAIRAVRMFRESQAHRAQLSADLAKLLAKEGPGF